MLIRKYLIIAPIVLLLGLCLVPPGELMAQIESEALGGVASSQQEGNMEGVVVSARRDGANFTVSVVSNAEGRYSFPRSHVEPGTYTVTTRAVGYDLNDPGTVEVTANQATSLDLGLQPTADLASQLSSLEWVMSMTGTTEEKDQLVYQALSCAYCHTYERIMKSRYTADELVPVIQRMQNYYQDGTAQGRGGRGRAQPKSEAQLISLEQNPPQDAGIAPGAPIADLAKYIATNNLSDGRTTWPYELKMLPRPTGQATRVVITQWDMPRRGTVPHDMDVDSQGIFWYTDESRQIFGKLDPKTNEFTEYPLPPVPDGDVPGARDIQMDQDDNPWLVMRTPGSGTILVKFDRETEELTTIDGTGGQFLSLGPDGKMWVGLQRIDPETMQLDAEFTWNDSPNLPPGPHGSYAGLTGIDSKGNPYLTDFMGSHIIEIDVETEEANFYEVPTQNSMPRRARMDAQDRFWFAEYTGDQIGVFDTKTKEFQEWPLPYKYTTPYTVSRPDNNGYVYASSNMSERILRLNTNTGEVIEYQIPTDFDAKKIGHDPTTNGVALWMANTRNARVTRVEPLD